MYVSIILLMGYDAAKVVPYIWEQLGMCFIFEPNFGWRASYPEVPCSTVQKWQYIQPSLWTWPQRQQQFFTWHSLPHDDAPPYQVWIQKVEWFRQYLQDKARHMDMTIPADPTNLVHTVYPRSKMFSQSSRYSEAQLEQVEAKCRST